MKTRKTLVSNSSSTSFIIAYKNSDKCPTCGRSDHDLTEIIDRVSDDDNSERTHVEIRGFDNVMEHIQTEWGCDWNDIDPVLMVDKLNEFKSTHQNWEFILGSVSYHDDTVKDMIREKETNGTLVKIWSDHG